MTEEEFKKLKPGDKVRIVKKRVAGMNMDGEMDKWLGTVMTVRKMLVGGVQMEEDKGERKDRGWFWNRQMIEYKVRREDSRIDLLVRDNKTIAKRDNGKVGIAKCDPRDKFDEAKGVIIAVARAYGWQYADDDTDNLTLTRHAEPRKETAKDRVKRELKELSERRNSLSRVLQGASKKLPESMKVEDETFNLLEMRLRIMEMYEAILARRLAIWKD